MKAVYRTSARAISGRAKLTRAETLGYHGSGLSKQSKKLAPARFACRAIYFVMAQQQEVISAINNLIETLKDGEKGFKEAADAVQDPELKALFREYSQQRSRFVNQLQTQARTLGESDPEKSSSAAGAMHRAWINLKSAITSGDDHAILAECERGEDSAVKQYEEALDDGLTAPISDIVSEQYIEVMAAHDRIKELRDKAEKE